MELLQLRNATVKLTYGGTTFLIDPMLSQRGALEPFPSLRGDERNPLHDLPLPITEILDGVDVVLVTHSHVDHWDPEAARTIPKHTPILVQDRFDADIVAAQGFTDVRILENTTAFGQVTLTRVEGQHYDAPELVPLIVDVTGTAATMGVVLRAEGEPTVYFTGDTVWFTGVEEALRAFSPEVVVANAGGNRIPLGRLVLDDAEVALISRAAPAAAIVAVHMEAVNHWGTSKAQLRQTAAASGFTDRLFVPADGESLTFPHP
ncbi:MBL fold metallo-hydrolase [Actinomyces procaprae]|uniref:MBL fold metallo-hydrolase n=1 Tax=Actinomyces procaprae TaxID=2560010 RepID=UPI00109DCBA9|nr:MBL fold metallo-hydrolase [Actinomyces procaprae]